MQTQTDIEIKLKAIFKKVLDIKESEIVPGAKLDESLGIDSTEMVEIAVVIKKEFGVNLQASEIKKYHSFNEIVEILKLKNQSGGGCDQRESPTKGDGGGHSCGCKH